MALPAFVNAASAEATTNLVLATQHQEDLGLLADVPAYGPITRAGDIAITHRTDLNGQRWVGLDDQVFIDVYLIPVQGTSYPLGNIVADVEWSVLIWNALPASVTLVARNYDAESGVYVVGPAAGLVMGAYQDQAWTIQVGLDGPPSMDTTVEWGFSDGSSRAITITGTRITTWAFVPDWSGGVLERLTAATDILQSESAASQRRALRIAPRREFEAQLYAEGRERQLLDLALFGWGHRVWAMPIWPDIQLLSAAVPMGAYAIPCSTEHLDFRAGGLAVLRGESAFDAETVEIDSVTAGGLQLARPTGRNWPVGTRLYPARTAQLLEQPALSKLTDRLYSTDVRFLVVEPCDWPAVMPSTLYRGRPVWAKRPDDSEDLTHGFERLQSTLDNGMSIPLLSDSAGRALTTLGQRWLGLGRAERAAVRSFIYAMRGRQAAVWVPTHTDDLTLAARVLSTDTSIDVGNSGWSRFGAGRAGRRDIRIELYGGAVFMRRVLAGTELSAAVERLSLDSGLGQQVEPEQVMRISWMVLCRFAADAQEIEHMTDSEGLASWSVVFREERDDEF